MEVGTCTFHRLAKMKFHQLDSDEQARVRETLAALVETPVAQWPPEKARRLPGDPAMFLVRVDDSLRLFVQVVEGRQPEVLDIVHQETLDFFAKAASRNGK
jgi:hypothetical protein